MRTSPLLWILRHIRRRIPALALLTAAQVAHAIFAVLFALGSRGVIDSAVQGVRADFVLACVRQAGIIAGILLSLTLVRHLREKLRLPGIQHGPLEQVLNGVGH